MPRSRPPRHRMSAALEEQARAAEIQMIARRRFERRTLHLFILSLAAFPTALLAMRSVSRHSHISFCVSGKVAPVIGTALLLLSTYLVASLFVKLLQVTRHSFDQVRDEMIALVVILIGGSATYIWLGVNLIQKSCLA